jgi:thiamine-monophosphate kinase
MKDDDEHPRTPSSYESHPRVSSSRSEFDFIDSIRRRVSSSLNTQNSSLLAGIGDDAAVFKQASGRDTVVTTDLLVEEIDFRRSSTEPRLLGHKALAVSLSDIAAMGARPRWALCSLGVPQETWDTNFLDEFYEGLFALAGRYDVQLIGGDVSRTPERIVIDSIVLGECESMGAVFRSGAKPGDRLFVTGSLGGAASGLRLMERGARLDKIAADDEWNLIHDLLLRQLCPQPRVGWGLVLGQERLASAMIDISDGLSSDLHHFCRESNVGALIHSGSIPVNPVVTELCGRRALDPLLLALHGGEDFELLFAVSSDNVEKLPRKVDGIPFTEIGEIRPAADGIRISEGARVWDLKPEGWKHF